jgi:hypothetical protein
LAEQLHNDGITRQYIGFDMTLTQAPMPHPENFHFIEHNILVPFPDEYVSTFDVVHVRLLGGALKKVEIPAAVQNIIQLLSKNHKIQLLLKLNKPN